MNLSFIKTIHDKQLCLEFINRVEAVVKEKTSVVIAVFMVLMDEYSKIELIHSLEKSIILNYPKNTIKTAVSLRFILKVKQKIQKLEI